MALLVVTLPLLSSTSPWANNLPNHPNLPTLQWAHGLSTGAGYSLILRLHHTMQPEKQGRGSGLSRWGPTWEIRTPLIMRSLMAFVNGTCEQVASFHGRRTQIYRLKTRLRRFVFVIGESTARTADMEQLTKTSA